MKAKFRFAARLGAAAFAAGLSLAAPHSGAVAHADSRAETDTADTGAPAPGRAARGAATPPASASAPRTASVPRPAAAAATEQPADSDVPVVRSRRGPATARIGGAAVVGPPEKVVAPQEYPPPPVVTPVAAPEALAPVPVAAPAAPTPPAVTPAPAIQPAGAAQAAPRAVAAVNALSGVTAKASSSALVDNLLAPIRLIFGEGTALLVRRTLFNEAPSVAPVQLTGQTTGPITGTLGAVDRDGDKLTYTLTSDPRYGTAVINSDGTYTYTPATGFAGNDSFIVAVKDTGFHINLLDLFRPASTSASVAVAQGALATMLRFQFVYGAGSQYWSTAARSALETAATQLTSYIRVNSPVTVTYAVTATSSPFSSTLATAGSDFVDGGAGFLQTVVQNKIQTGSDANGSAADGTIDWNFGRTWGYGTPVPGGEYDFQSIAMHELLHTLGFLSNITEAGTNTARTWTLFDSYVVNAAGTAAVGGDYAWKSAFDANLTGGNGGLYFGGPNAVAAYGSRVPLFTPSPWQSGSSVSHLADAVFSGPNRSLMNAVVQQGTAPRVLSPVELGILADIGYTLAGPGAPSVLFVLVGFGIRRRRD